MKKTLKELFLIFVIIFIAVELKIYTPILKLSQIVFPQLYYTTEASVVDIEEKRWRMVEGVVYSKYTLVEYTLNGKKYNSELFYRSSDKEGWVVCINVFKSFPNIMFRDTMEMPTISEIILFITLIQAFIYLIRIQWYEPRKVKKTNGDYIRKAKTEMPELYSFLKNNKSIELINDLMMIQDKFGNEELNGIGLFTNEKINAIIEETEKQWENGNKLDYIIIGDNEEKTIMYKKDEGFIYSYDKKNFKYTFEAGSLVKYLKLLGYQ